MSSRGRTDAQAHRRSARLLHLPRLLQERTPCPAALAFLITAIGCGSQSLVPIDVLGDAPFSNVELRIFPSVGYPKTVDHVSFSSTTALEIGIYLPEKAAGTVQVMAEAVDGHCVVGRGAATATNVHAGAVSPTVTLPITHVTGCEAPTGGSVGGAAGGAGGTTQLGLHDGVSARGSGFRVVTR